MRAFPTAQLVGKHLLWFNLIKMLSRANRKWVELSESKSREKKKRNETDELLLEKIFSEKDAGGKVCACNDSRHKYYALHQGAPELWLDAGNSGTIDKCKEDPKNTMPEQFIPWTISCHEIVKNGVHVQRYILKLSIVCRYNRWHYEYNTIPSKYANISTKGV